MDTRMNEYPIGPSSSIPDARPFTFVLAHGAWHDGRAWEAVKIALERQGYQVLTPTMAGHGPEAASRHATRAACAASIIETILQEDLHEVVLVAHSFAGLIAPLVVEALPERIAQVIFLDALIPVEGENAFFGTPTDDAVPLEQHADGTITLPLEVWLTRFWRDETAVPALASSERGEMFWQTQLSPEALTAVLEPAHLAQFAQLREAGLPTTFIRCRGDYVFGDPAFWQIMIDRLPGCRVVEMEGGHEIMFTQPELLAATLLAAMVTTTEVPVPTV